MQEVIMICGMPASGKSTLVKRYQGHTILNRDTTGGSLESLRNPFGEAILRGESIILDNLNATVDSRKPFLDIAKTYDVPVICEWMTTKAEDCQINALMRMWNRYGRVFLHPDDIKNDPKAKKDSNIFPITVIFHYKKIFEKPIMAEGFAAINKQAFVREWPDNFVNKAVFFDYDGTLRDVVNGQYKFPTKESEVELLPNVKEVINKLWNYDTFVFGVSNQSGIARGQVSENDVKACFAQTNKLIGRDIPVAYCPHNVPPCCYCRKPQAGLAIPFICEYHIDVSKSIMVGDQTTDRTFATRLGMKYMDHTEFFKRG